MGNIVYEATPQAYAEQEAALAGELGGGGAPISVSSNALGNFIVVKGGAGSLYGFTVLNTKVSAQFIQWFDLLGLPADGTVPAGVISVPASTSVGVSWLDVGRWHNIGIVLCNSSTAATKTIGAADCFFDVQYL